jgi:membrane protease YdiL (CAAX protease family)
MIYLGCNYGLLFLAQIISGYLIKGPLACNALLCILLLLFTRLILSLEGMTWADIGCLPGSKQGAKELILGILAGTMMLLITTFSLKWLTGSAWEKNPAFHYTDLLPLLMTVFCSVFAQELAFRGYQFRLLLDRWGQWPAQLLVAFPFGLMHFHDHMSLQEMLSTLLNTGVGSLLFGIAVIRTGRLQLAVGLHFGWNFAQVLIPRHPLQNGQGIWLIHGGPVQLPAGVWMAPYLLVVLIAFLLIRRLPATAS